MTNDFERKLAFVPPARRAFVQRRIQILEEHMRLAEPTVEDADRAAEALGITRISFYRLLRAWKNERDPANIGVPGRSGRRGRQEHPGDPFIESLLASMPSGLPIDRYVKAITTAAERAGLEIRSHTSLTAMVRELRQPEGIKSLFVDHVVLRMPVHGPDYPMMPTATVLGNGLTGAIHATALALEVPNPRGVARLIKHARERGALAPSDRGETVRLALETDSASDWRPLLKVLAGHGVARIGDDHGVSHGGRLGRDLLFPELLGVRTMTRLVARSRERRRARFHDRLDEILSLEQAQSLMDERLDAASSRQPALLGDDLDGLLADLDQAGLL